jgi:Flp pilus assembly CpaE family ATPase
MLRTIIVSPDAPLCESLQAALERFESDVTVSRVLPEYPDREDLARIVRAHAPGAAFLGFEDPEAAASTARMLVDQAPGIQIIALHRTSDAELLRHSMRAGIRDFLIPPFADDVISQSLALVMRNLERQPVEHGETEQVLAFLPCKAGAGATTLALNIARALAHREHHRVLLGDLDLSSGALRFLLHLTNPKSALEAVVNRTALDERTWPEYVTAFGNLDVLHPGPVNPAARVDPTQLVALTHYMRRNYESLCFDLSGNLEQYSVAVMREASHLVMVCTPDVPSMHLAKEKLVFLAGQGLAKKVRVVMNRMNRGADINERQAEKILDAEVFASFSDDPEVFGKVDRKPIDFESPAGRELMAFVGKVEQTAADRMRLPQNKFLEFFYWGVRRRA